MKGAKPVWSSMKIPFSDNSQYLTCFVACWKAPFSGFVFFLTWFRAYSVQIVLFQRHLFEISGNYLTSRLLRHFYQLGLSRRLIKKSWNNRNQMFTGHWKDKANWEYLEGHLHTEGDALAQKILKRLYLWLTLSQGILKMRNKAEMETVYWSVKVIKYICKGPLSKGWESY